MYWNSKCILSLAIGRTLIPRYFRSIFEGGATELFYTLKHPKESFHTNFVSLDCDQCTMVTQNGKPMFTQVRKYTFWSIWTFANTHYIPHLQCILVSFSPPIFCALYDKKPYLALGVWPLTSLSFRCVWRAVCTWSSCLTTWWESRRGILASDNTEKSCLAAYWPCTWVADTHTHQGFR